MSYEGFDLTIDTYIKERSKEVENDYAHFVFFHPTFHQMNYRSTIL
jgi:hypothetical protein